MTGPAGERLDLIAEVFDDEPPNESATRVTLGAPVAIGTPAGERLEPVEPRQPLTEGRYVMTAPVEIDNRGRIEIKAFGESYYPGDAFPGAMFQRVVVDPPLPDELGRVALVEVSGEAWSSGPRHVISENGPVSRGRPIEWCDTVGNRWVSKDITRVLYVYPEPRDTEMADSGMSDKPVEQVEVGDVLEVGSHHGHYVVKDIRPCPRDGGPHPSYLIYGPAGPEWICTEDGVPLVLYAKPLARQETKHE